MEQSGVSGVGRMLAKVRSNIQPWNRLPGIRVRCGGDHEGGAAMQPGQTATIDGDFPSPAISFRDFPNLGIVWRFGLSYARKIAQEMFDELFRDSHNGRREVDCQVECLWESVANPILVCALRIDHALTNACEEVDVLITGEGTIIHHRAFNPALSTEKETTFRSAQSSEQLESKLRASGIFDLGCAEQGMFDGARSEIAVKDQDATNVFSERSVDTPQAEVRKLLLALANGPDCADEEEDGGEGLSCSDSEMDFVVTTPNQ